MQQQMMNNPQMVDDLMNSPIMQNLMSNPELIRQTMNIARNPELLREQMRSTDRAMSNIEAHPEGFNMLRRMYENVQEPLLDAATGDGGSPAPPAPAPTPGN